MFIHYFKKQKGYDMNSSTLGDICYFYTPLKCNVDCTRGMLFIPKYPSRMSSLTISTT
ncbi:hypothetical protein NC653_033535 [Populus alba x Populus x berolinensis]|uniref:Uncharacterized protein n=1 Tax=Populus alba x Populus x berolinensis TaxID=444605 RepID=A0AAD6LV56_9ROSI|nr:hypothetical protein NC653_033535 [Populus alba x Populus x berolinensis]